MSSLAYVGISLHSILFAALVAVCGFDDGQLAHDWTDCLIPLGIVLIPLVLAVVGVARRSTGFLMSAAVMGGLVFIIGPGLFVLVPAILYGVAVALSPPTQGQSS